jgi:hypothetical protein
MDAMDKIISTQTQITMLHAQIYELMKIQQKNIEEESKEFPPMLALAVMYRMETDHQNKAIEYNQHCLEKYKEMKKNKSPEE